MTDNRTTELLPCPFCGGEAEIIESDYGMYLTGYAVYCKGECHAKLGVSGRLGEAYEWTPVFDTEAEAIEAWNTRHERTCELTEVEIDCGSASEWMLDRFFVFDSVYKCSCGETFGYVARNRPNFCPNCGRKVVSA